MVKMRCKYGGPPPDPKKETWGERCVRKMKEQMEEDAQKPEPIDRTERGFGVFGRLVDRDGSQITVSESSIAYEGAHVRVYVGGSSGAMHMGLDSTKMLIEALQLFVDTAESGGCTEPAPEKSRFTPPHSGVSASAKHPGKFDPNTCTHCGFDLTETLMAQAEREDFFAPSLFGQKSNDPEPHSGPPVPAKVGKVQARACQEEGCTGWTRPATRKGSPWWLCNKCGKIFPFSQAELNQLMREGTGDLPVPHRYPWEKSSGTPEALINGAMDKIGTTVLDEAIIRGEGEGHGS